MDELNMGFEDSADDELALLEERIRQKAQQGQVAQSSQGMHPAAQILLGLGSGLAGGLTKTDGAAVYNNVMKQQQDKINSQSRLKALEDNKVMTSLVEIAKLRSRQKERTEDRSARNEDLMTRLQVQHQNQLNYLAAMGANKEQLMQIDVANKRAMTDLMNQHKTQETDKQRTFIGDQNEKNRALKEKELGAKQQATKEKAVKKPAGDVAKIRKELSATSSAKDMQDVVASYERIKQSAANDSPAGDIALIFNYMKMLDPGSTVREGEFATAQNAGSIPERIRAMYNKAKEGERLTPKQREDFFSQAGNQYNAQLNAYNQQRAYYGGIAKGQGLNPEDVGPAYNPIQHPAQTKNLNGVQYIKIPGGWKRVP